MNNTIAEMVSEDETTPAMVFTQSASSSGTKSQRYYSRNIYLFLLCI
jgi:hypothetical protein